MSAAWTPKRVPARVDAVGVPPRWMVGRALVARVSKPVFFSISSAICCPMPPRRMCPNSSTFSVQLAFAAPSFAPSATTTMEKFTPRDRCRRQDVLAHVLDLDGLPPG